LGHTIDKIVIYSPLTVFIKGDMENASRFHRNALFLGIIHFQDLYNIDLERTKKCGIHYAIPDDRIIPALRCFVWVENN